MIARTRAAALLAAFVSLAAGGCESKPNGDGFEPPFDLAAALTEMAPSQTDLTEFTDSALAEPDLALPDDLALPPDLSVAVPDDLAAPLDLSNPDLADPQNPFGIHLTDVTIEALGGKIYGGRSRANILGVGTGAAIGDLDGDGRLDLVFARNDDPASDKPGGPSLLLHNSGELGGFAGTHFVADSAFSKMMAGAHCHGVGLGDYDRDGDLDIFFACDGKDFLLQNDGAGHFTDVAAAAGVAGPNDDFGNGAVFADLNHDGLLDLYVVDWMNEVPMVDKRRNRLYLNMGDGTFTDVSAISGTDNNGSSWAAAIFDLDMNGQLGIYVANDQFATDGNNGGKNFLPDAWYRLASIDDQGVPHYKDVAAQQGVIYIRSGMAVTIADVDGDLTPDLYLADIGKKSLYLNTAPGGPVTEAANQYNLAARMDDEKVFRTSWGSRFVDLDRDGSLELFLDNGFFFDPIACEAERQVPMYLRQPAPGQPYEEITQSSGIAIRVPTCPGGVGELDRVDSRAVVQGDLDGDGDDDFVLTPYGSPFFLYRNDTPRLHHALRVRLQGTVSSPDPVGATLVATRISGSKAAMFRYAGGDTQSQSDSVLTVGLGDDAGVIRVDVKWPSGITQRIDQLPGFAIDQLFLVTEPAWLTVEPRVMKPGDAAPRLIFRPVDEAGSPLGMKGSKMNVTATRSDGVSVQIVDNGDGTYAASLPHPGIARRSVVTLFVDGQPTRPLLSVLYK